MVKIMHNYFSILFIFCLLLVCAYSIEPTYMYDSDIKLEENEFLYAAGYFSKNVRNNYLKKQGITLDYDSTCEYDGSEFNASTFDSSYNNIYEHAIFHNNSNQIKCRFPISAFSTTLYTFYYKIALFDPRSINSTQTATINIIKNGNVVYTESTVILKKMITIQITYADNNQFNIKYENNLWKTSTNGLANYENRDQNKITFSFTTNGHSPAIAMYYVTLKITENTNYYTYNGLSSCDPRINPCLQSFVCIGTTCQKCDASCMDCYSTAPSQCKSKCNVHAISPSPQPNQKCELGYVDLTEFNNFSVKGIYPPRTNSLTISFWIFYSSKANPVITSIIIIKNYLKLEMTFDTNLNVNYTAYDKYSLQNTTIGSGTWLYLKCGMSLEQNSFFIYLNEPINDNNIQGQTIASLNATKEFFDRMYYKEGETISMKFKSFNFNKNTGSGPNIYIRNLYLFRDYLPQYELISQTQRTLNTKYYSLEKFAGSLTFPELLLSLPFDHLFRNNTDSSYYITSITYGDSEKILTTNLYPTDTFNLYPNKNFIRLNLLENPNTKYSSKDLYDTSLIPGISSTVLYASDGAWPYSCKDGYYLEKDKVCKSECNEEYSIDPGISFKKGICKHVIKNGESSSNKAAAANFKNAFSCKSDAYFRLFYSCPNKTEEEKYVLYYRSDKNPGKLIFDLSSFNLNSYLIEIWYYSRKKEKGYIFYSNSIQLFKQGVESYDLKYPFMTKISGINNIKDKQWNNLIFNVVYDINEGTTMSFHVNYGLVNKSDLNVNKYALRKIYFCHKDPNCDGIQNLEWSSAYYKNLKVWDGSQASFNTLIRYDDLFSSMEYRIKSLKAHYPLYGSFISMNILKEYKTDSTGYYEPNSENIWDLQKYNYRKAVIEDCWVTDIETKCSKCENSKYLADNYSCQDYEKYYYLKFPSHASPLISTGLDENSPVTITLWIKLFGFGLNNNDIVYYSTNLKLSYEENEISDDFGLNLQSFSSSNYAETISNYHSFRENFGRWTFISVAFQPGNEEHFPPMLRFEVGKINYELKSKVDISTTIKEISFNTNIYALVGLLKIYNTFLIGVQNCDSNFNPKPTILLELTSNSDDECTLKSFNDNKSYKCAIDKLQKETCDSNFLEDCYDKKREDCSCNYQNSNKLMFFGKQEKFYCKLYEYINFANSNQTITLSKPVPDNKITMHFWIYAYSYVDMKFDGVILHWKNYLIMKVQKSQDRSKYQFSCQIDQKNIDASNTLDFRMNKWNFLHCSVDYEKTIFYMNTDIDTFSTTNIFLGDFDFEKPYEFTINDITTKKNWGVLFFRHIRLWNQAFESSSFLSRVDIKNVTAFNGLIHLWDGELKNYVNSLELKDLNGSSSLVPTNLDSVLTNVVDSEQYETLLLCPEDGKYYDEKTKQCIQFFDFSNINTDIITINDVPVSYNHNYGIAFWILLENKQKLDGPFEISWLYHMIISLESQSNGINAYCYPQYYVPYEELLKDKTNSEREKTVLNFIKDTISDCEGKWLWIQCSLSFYNRLYYLNDIDATILQPAKLYTNDDGTEVLNDAPQRYFFNYNAEEEKLKSTLIIKKPKGKNKKMYVRSLYLFKDHLPKQYSFKYMDMTKIESETFPPLALAINFAEWPKYYRYNYLNIKSKMAINDVGIVGEKELSSSFVFLPLCNPQTNEKYSIKTGLCETISSCNKEALNVIYCMDDDTPLICKKNYYINIKEEDNTLSCDISCPEGTFRTPGTTQSQGICSAKCLSGDYLMTCPSTSSGLISYPSVFACISYFSRIDYQCFDANTSPSKGALYYSHCNNPTTINHSFKNNLFLKGYIIEFWFMIDHVICTPKTGLNLYFYIDPHYIYKSSSDFFYKVGNSNGYGPLTEIHEYEWNKIVIVCDKQTSPGSSSIYINFMKDPFTKHSDCPNLGSLYFATSISIENKSYTWGSAYYNHIRFWNIEITNLELIQAYNNGFFTEIPKSLLLHFPLTIPTMDNNEFLNVITQYPFTISFKDVKNKLSKDNIILFDYSSKFDWGLVNPGNFVNNMEGTHIKSKKCDPSCTRCYKENDSEKCYECASGYVLVYQKCQAVINSKTYFLKTPSPTASTEINLLIKSSEEGESVSNIPGFTITFWMKFFGVISSSTSSQPVIFSLGDATGNLVYEVSSTNLLFKVGTAVAIRDEHFSDNFSKWIPISIANYISGSISNMFPHMFTLSVNRKDIQLDSNFVFPEKGITVTKLSFGYEVIALFGDLRIYRNFIQGAFGRIMAIQSVRDDNLIDHYNLIGKENDCVHTSELSSSVAISCIADYTIFVDEEKYCFDDLKYFEENSCHSEDCGSCNCNDYCMTLCFQGGEKDCTCDLTEGIYWLRRTDDVNKQTYCEKIEYLDFSNLNPILYESAPVTKTMEYAIELWIFVYSYNFTTNYFSDIQIEWDKHCKLYFYRDGDSFKLTYYPVFDMSNPSLYVNSKTQTLSFYKWNYVKVGTDLLNKKYYLGTSQYDITTDKELPDYNSLDSVKFKIYRSDKAYDNFGYIFIREIKVWQQYNFVYLNLQYIIPINFQKEGKNIDDTTGDTQDIPEIQFFPGLIMYFKNLYKDEPINSKLQIKEEVYGLKPRNEIGRTIQYVGYNVIDKDNEHRILPMENLCNMEDIKKVENGATIYKYEDCVGKNATADCEVFSKNNKCIVCQSSRFIHIVDGRCYDECPPYYFGNTNINQCRPCHPTCYRCKDRFYDSCTQCTGSLYYYDENFTCIENCESVGLTASQTHPNICVQFDADAILLHPNSNGIDIIKEKFEKIEAQVVGATSTGYFTQWRFDVNMTNIINEQDGFTDFIEERASPFPDDEDGKQLRANVINDFFKLGHTYVFCLDIIKEKNGFNITKDICWNLTINFPPYGGSIKIIPPIGLLQTTVFIATCYGWEDDDTSEEEFEYSFTYIEHNTNSELPMGSENFSIRYETYSTFNVRFYQQETTKIDITCYVKDKKGAISSATGTITIINKIGSPLYILSTVLSNFDFGGDSPDEENLLARSEFLKSIGVNPYREIQPSLYYTVYENSLDGSIVTKEDPSCVEDYCNTNGECGLIDVAISCDCKLGFIANNCNLDKNGYSTLGYYYQNLFDLQLELIGNNISPTQFKTIYNLFFAAQTFIQDSYFFTVNLPNFIEVLKVKGKNKIKQDTDQYIDFFDFYFKYAIVKQSQLKISGKNSANSPDRNYTLLLNQQREYQTAFGEIINHLHNATSFLIANKGEDYEYQSLHFSFKLIKIDSDFEEKKFFEDAIKNYRSHIYFTDCVNDKMSLSSYWIEYIEFFVNPYSFDSIVYPNITSPFILLNIYDSSGKMIEVKECTSSPVKVFLPFNSYLWLDYINTQKPLFNPDNYKSPDDPIFRDPIYIEPSGHISSDTVSLRIDEYYRHNNFTGLSYDSEKGIYSSKGFTYINYTQENNYIVFDCDHLGSFTSMLIPNTVEFVVDGRFFYIYKPQVLKYLPNYQKNQAFILMIVLFALFLFGCIFYYIYDYSYFEKEVILNFVKTEIVKVHMPYVEQGNLNINKIIPQFAPEVQKKRDIVHMFDNVNFGNSEDEDKDDKSDNIQNTITEEKENEIDFMKIKINKIKGDEDSDEDGGYGSSNGSDYNSEKGEKNKKEKVDKVILYSDKKTRHDNNTKPFKNNYYINGDKAHPNLVSIQMFHKNTPVWDEGELPEDFGNEDEDKARSLEAYANLKCTTSKFINWNIANRHLLISPIIKVSLFNPRWRKFYLFITQWYIALVLIAVMLTNDESINSKNITGMIKLGLISAIGSNVIMYFLIFFFRTSTYQRRRLFHFVIKGQQLAILKAFEKIKKNNKIWGMFGMVICTLIWAVCFYISVIFVAVWKDQNSALIISIIIAMVFDLLIFELLIEVFIGVLFALRKKTECIRNFGEWMNRVRCYRTLWP